MKLKDILELKTVEEVTDKYEKIDFLYPVVEQTQHYIEVGNLYNDDISLDELKVESVYTHKINHNSFNNVSRLFYNDKVFGIVVRVGEYKVFKITDIDTFNDFSKFLYLLCFEPYDKEIDLEEDDASLDSIYSLDLKHELFPDTISNGLFNVGDKFRIDVETLETLLKHKQQKLIIEIDDFSDKYLEVIESVNRSRHPYTLSFVNVKLKFRKISVGEKVNIGFVVCDVDAEDNLKEEGANARDVQIGEEALLSNESGTFTFNNSSYEFLNNLRIKVK